MTTIEEVNKWVSTAKKGQEAMYYKGFFVFEANKDYQMKKFSNDLLDLEKKTNSFFLYQKKIKEGFSTGPLPIYEYCIQKK